MEKKLGLIDKINLKIHVNHRHTLTVPLAS